MNRNIWNVRIDDGKTTASLPLPVSFGIEPRFARPPSVPGFSNLRRSACRLPCDFRKRNRGVKATRIIEIRIGRVLSDRPSGPVAQPSVPTTRRRENRNDR